MWRSEGAVGGEVLAKRGMEPASPTCLPCPALSFFCQQLQRHHRT